MYPVASALLEYLLPLRAQAGQQTYGTPLQTHNGRDPLWDALEELVDALQYTVQARMELADLMTALEPVKAEVARVTKLDADFPSTLLRDDYPRSLQLTAGDVRRLHAALCAETSDE